MYIQCTKKLLAKLEQPLGELSFFPDPFFCWHASFVESHGVQFAVMVNDETGEELYFPLRSFKDFDKQVLQAMTEEILDEGASAKAIAEYFKAAGTILFGPTRNHSFSGRLGGSTRRMKAIIDWEYTLENGQDTTMLT